MRRRVVEEVAVEIDVVLVHPPQPREAERIHGVQQHQRDVVRHPRGDAVAQQEVLDARAAEALDPVRARGEEEHAPRALRPEARDVEEERRAVRPRLRVCDRRADGAGLSARAQEGRARRGVVRREAGGRLRGGHRIILRRHRARRAPPVTVRSTRIAAMRVGATASGFAERTTRSARLPARERALLGFLELELRGVAREEPQRLGGRQRLLRLEALARHAALDRVQHVERLDRRVRGAADAARRASISARSG